MTTKELFIHYLLCILFALLLFLCIGYTAHATEVTLQWNASDGATGYKIYYGSASGVYRSSIDTIQDTTYVMTLINPGTYYFVVTAYNDYGESGYSNEVHARIYSYFDVDKDGDVDGLDLNKFSGEYGI